MCSSRTPSVVVARAYAGIAWGDQEDLNQRGPEGLHWLRGVFNAKINEVFIRVSNPHTRVTELTCTWLQQGQAHVSWLLSFACLCVE